MAVVVSLLVGLVVAPGAAAGFRPLKPPPGQVFFGVTDTGDAEDFRDFAAAVGKHPAVIETYHPYANSLHEALPRWQETRARPIIHISTVDGDREVMNPRAIALGRGDDYLLRLNRTFAREDLPAYIRPLGEPNRCLNPYTPYDCAGNSRGRRYSPFWYRQMFRRMYVLLHGGARIEQINRKLKRIHLPRVNRRLGREPSFILEAPVALIWSPLPAGSPGGKRNRPGRFWPGARYVDWVGTDFYSLYPYWRDLRRFFRNYARRYRKPFVLTEFGVWGADDPRFVRRLLGFCRQRPKCRMLVYYQDFGTSNEFRIQNYPASENVLRNKLRARRYPALAPHPPVPEQETGGIQF